MKKTLLLLFAAAGLLGCSDDDGNTTDPQLENAWAMTSYVAFMETLPQLEGNEIIWMIDSESGELTVYNSVEEEYPYILPSGTYEFSTGNGIFTIETGEWHLEYEYSFNEAGTTLILDSNLNGMVDGPVMNFELANQGGAILN